MNVSVHTQASPCTRFTLPITSFPIVPPQRAIPPVCALRLGWGFGAGGGLSGGGAERPRSEAIIRKFLTYARAHTLTKNHINPRILTIPPRGRFRRFAPYGLAGVLALGAVSVAVVQSDPGLKRSWQFWRGVFPIYLQYELVCSVLYVPYEFVL